MRGRQTLQRRQRVGDEVAVGLGIGACLEAPFMQEEVADARLIELRDIALPVTRLRTQRDEEALAGRRQRAAIGQQPLHGTCVGQGFGPCAEELDNLLGAKAGG